MPGRPTAAQRRQYDEQMTDLRRAADKGDRQDAYRMIHAIADHWEEYHYGRPLHEVLRADPAIGALYKAAVG